MTLTHTQKLRLQTHDGIVLWKAKDGGGDMHYAYLKADSAQIQAMSKAFKGGINICFADYGEIILIGIGNSPSAKHQSYMEENYNFVHSTDS